MLGYVGRKVDGSYAPFHWNSSLASQDIEISDDVFIIQRELAETYEAGKITPTLDAGVGSTTADNSSMVGTSPSKEGKQVIPANIPRLLWTGDVPHQRWMNFYTKVLSKFAASGGLKLTIRVEVAPTEGVSPQKIDETKAALRELGLKDSLEDDFAASKG